MNYKSGAIPVMDNCGKLFDNDSDEAHLLANVFIKDNSMKPKFEWFHYDSSNKINVYFSQRKLLKPLTSLRPIEVTIIYIIY